MTTNSIFSFGKASMPLFALTVVAGLAGTAPALATEGGRGGGTQDGNCATNPDCNPQTPTTGGDTTTTNNNTVTGEVNGTVTGSFDNDITNNVGVDNTNNVGVGVNVDNNVNNNAQGGNATATGGDANAIANGGQGGNAVAHGGQGGQGGEGGQADADANAISGSHSNAVVGDTTSNSDSNATVGDTTATVGDTTSTSGASANNSGQSVSISHQEAARAYAPAAYATGGNGVKCGESVGVSLGVGTLDTAVSGAINLPAGVNETCMTHERATTIIHIGASLYGHNQSAASDMMAVALGTYAQEDEKVNASLRHVADMNCASGNPIDRFRPNCGTAVRRPAPAPAVK